MASRQLFQSIHCSTKSGVVVWTFKSDYHPGVGQVFYATNGRDKTIYRPSYGALAAYRRTMLSYTVDGRPNSAKRFAVGTGSKKPVAVQQELPIQETPDKQEVVTEEKVF